MCNDVIDDTTTSYRPSMYNATPNSLPFPSLPFSCPPRQRQAPFCPSTSDRFPSKVTPRPGPHLFIARLSILVLSPADACVSHTPLNASQAPIPARNLIQRGAPQPRRSTLARAMNLLLAPLNAFAPPSSFSVTSAQDLSSTTRKSYLSLCLPT